jgi:hypothetical protein
MNEALQAMPSAGLDAAEITALLVCRLADLKAFELPRFAGAPDDEVGHPLDLRSQACRRAQAATSAFDAGPAMPPAVSSQRRTDGRFLRHG